MDVNEVCETGAAIPSQTVKEQIKAAQKQLGILSQRVKEKSLPVILLFEGWGASGKGTIIGKVIEELDPRGFKVYTIGERTPDERRYPLMTRYWSKIPEYGKISIFDRSWYRDVSISRVENNISKRELDMRFREILDFETQLSDDGYLILKFFLRLSKKEQRKRFEALEDDKSTKWRVTDADWEHNRNYDDYLHAFDEMIERTDREYAPWIQIDAADRKHAQLTVLQCRSTCDEALEALDQPKSDAEIRSESTDYHPNPYPSCRGSI